MKCILTHNKYLKSNEQLMWASTIQSRKLSEASSSNISQPRIGVCFLISNRFETLPLWSKWMQSNDVKGFIHYSNTSSEEKEEIISFSKSTNSDIVNSIPTKWGTSSLLKAEAILYDAAAKIDSIAYFWLVSEKTAPIVSVPYLMSYTSDILRSKTQIAPIDDPNQYNYELYKIVSPKIAVNQLKFANQFKYINAAHWQRIRNYVNEMVNMIPDDLHWSKDNEKMMHPDEFVIPTYLVHMGCELETTEKSTWDYFEGNNKRAKRLTLEDVKIVVQKSTMKRKAPIESSSRRKKSIPKKLESIDAYELSTQLIEYVQKAARVLSIRKILREDQDIFDYLEKLYV